MRKLIICAAILIHGWLSFMAFMDHGYAGYFPPFPDTNTTQIFSDLVLALSLVNIWVYFDLKRHGKPISWFFTHLVATAMVGSFAPLVYLLIRDDAHSVRNTNSQPPSVGIE